MAVTVAPLVALKPAAGAQLYVLAPLAVRPTEPPAQNVVEPLAVIATVGSALTVTVMKSLNAGHGPAGSLLVKVNVTVPAV